MISGLTLKTPTPTPLTVPTARPTARAMPSATTGPDPLWLAATYAAKFAVMTVERSMPPVSMHSVWLAARMASGQASSSVDRTPLALNRPGSTSPVTTYRTSRTPPRTMAGRSTSAWRHWVIAGSAVAALTWTSAGSAPGRRS